MQMDIAKADPTILLAPTSSLLLTDKTLNGLWRGSVRTVASPSSR